MATNDEEKQLAALDLYNALKCKDELIQLSNHIADLPKN